LKRLVAAMAILAIPSVAHAGTNPIEQDNQLVFGLSGAFVPAQNNLDTDVLAIGHYVAFTHAIDCVHIGARIAFSIGNGPQYLFDPSAFIGLHYKTGRLALRLDAGTGPLVNVGDGFKMAVIDHTYARAVIQLRVVKSVIIEAFGGPGFVIGSSVVGVMAEWGVGAGWNF